MSPSSSSKDKFYEKAINPYLPEVMKHPQTMELSEGVFHTRDVQGPKKEGSEKARLEAVEQEIFMCQGMVERGLSANHSMIMEFIHEHKGDNKDIGEAIFKLDDRVNHLQAQIYDLQNQNCEYESRFKKMSLAADFGIPETRSSFFDEKPMPWKPENKPTTSSPPSPKNEA
ncbi:uncharacterized protein [Aegilops tauschii subsp. strangulata]|uniref:uncharacterized protein n=1 Tax=Aegilops tauschii subsp. strangulata TaxID=200361 RepID=UPI00098A5739|nr:uncharacterized protein LOC109758613 [Aegilops tauschii subsp. strangulata]